MRDIVHSTYASPEASFCYLSDELTGGDQEDDITVTDFVETNWQSPLKKHHLRSETDGRFLDDEMPASDNLDYEVRSGRRTVKKCFMVFKDDIQSCIPDEVTIDFLKEKRTIAESLKTDLQTATLLLSEKDEDYFTANLSDEAERTRAAIVVFILAAEKRSAVYVKCKVTTELYTCNRVLVLV